MYVAPLMIGVACAAWLAADLYLHESPSHIRRKMLRTLRASKLPASVSVSQPSALLRVLQEPLIPSFPPTLVLGPTGCGKTTLLSRLVRDNASTAQPAPVVFVRFRLPSSTRAVSDAAEGIAQKEMLDAAASQLFAQIGYPMRASILGGIFERGFSLRGERSHAVLATPSRTRLLSALTMLFSVCEQLNSERLARGMPPDVAAPLLIFDEAHDLIKDARLKCAGGDRVFETLGTLLVAYGVDRQAVRAVVAGSSAELADTFARVSPAHGGRLRYYELLDPPADVVSAALRERGYSESETSGLIALCGTRLRLLGVPLRLGAARAKAAPLMEAMRATGAADFNAVFQLLAPDAAAQLTALLDTLAAIDAGFALVGTSPPMQWDLPTSVRIGDVSRILYLKRDGALIFQSQLHRCAWAHRRGNAPPACPLHA
jgi:hypothetical protein